MEEHLEPGTYEVEIVLSALFHVEEGDEMTEDDLKSMCRKRGATINWEVDKVE